MPFHQSLAGNMGAYVFAVDLPTGLDGDSGQSRSRLCHRGFYRHDRIRKARIARRRRVNFVGRLEVVQLDELRSPEKKPKEVVAAPPALRELLPRRKFSTYKNQCGRIGVVAGSRGFIGAALMTSQGALRAGAGLVEVFVPKEIYEIVAGAAPMESMVQPTRVLPRFTQRKGRCLGRGTRSWKIARCRNTRADRKSEATNGD